MPVAPKGGNNLLQLAIGDLVRHGRRRRHALTALVTSGSTSNDRRDRDERSCDGEGSPTPPHSPVRSGSPRSPRSEEHTSEHTSLMRISYAGIYLKKKTNSTNNPN